jgi:hypothetical protein
VEVEVNARSADADHPSPARLERRYRHDREFLSWLRAASLEELVLARIAYENNGPQWKLAAVERALHRRTP